MASHMNSMKTSGDTPLTGRTHLEIIMLLAHELLHGYVHLGRRHALQPRQKQPQPVQGRCKNHPRLLAPTEIRHWQNAQFFRQVVTGVVTIVNLSSLVQADQGTRFWKFVLICIVALYRSQKAPETNQQAQYGIWAWRCWHSARDSPSCNSKDWG